MVEDKIIAMQNFFGLEYDQMVNYGIDKLEAMYDKNWKCDVCARTMDDAPVTCQRCRKNGYNNYEFKSWKS